MQLQVFYSALDQAYHSDPKTLEDRNTTDILQDVQKRFYSLPYVTNTVRVCLRKFCNTILTTLTGALQAWQLRFSHLVGYGAKYYSYLISRAVASWTWHKYFSNDPFSRCQGERYRNECLRHGGAIPSKQLVSNFLGRNLTPENLSQSLINELDMNNRKIDEISKQL